MEKEILIDYKTFQLVIVIEYEHAEDEVGKCEDFEVERIYMDKTCLTDLFKEDLMNDSKLNELILTELNKEDKL